MACPETLLSTITGGSLMKKTLSILNDNRLNILRGFVLACPETLLSTICHVTTRITTFAYRENEKLWKRTKKTFRQ